MFMRVVLAFLLFNCSIASANASVVNFDNIDASLGDVSLDAISPYQGLTWTNFSAYTGDPSYTGFNNGIVSQSNAAYSGGENFGATATPVIGKIQAANPFNFVSGYVGAGYYDALNVTVRGLLGGSVVFNKTITVGTSGAHLVDFGFTNIDELDFFGIRTAQTTDLFCAGQ